MLIPDLLILSEISFDNASIPSGLISILMFELITCDLLSSYFSRPADKEIIA